MYFLWMYSTVCVEPGRIPLKQFSGYDAQMILTGAESTEYFFYLLVEVGVQSIFLLADVFRWNRDQALETKFRLFLVLRAGFKF